jgi:hypothetical protein
MMNFKIEADFKPTLEWLEKIKRGLDDARPLWMAMIPRIREFVDEEFSGNNPNKWQSLTPKYRHWKAQHGFPHWIGVLTGNLKKASGQNAKVKINPKWLEWAVNTDMTQVKGGNYGIFFSRGTSKMPARQIFRSSKMRINNFLKKDINDMEGGSRMAFTFAWLNKAIEGNRK